MKSEMSQTRDLPSPDAVLSLLKSRRSIRRYRPDPVPDEMVVQLLEAGRWAPSASNRQLWDFIVVRDEAVRQQVAEHAAFYFIFFPPRASIPSSCCPHVRGPVPETARVSR